MRCEIVDVLCHCANVCQNIFDSFHVRFNHLCRSILAYEVCSQYDLHKLVAIASIITQHRLEGASILSWSGSPTSFF